MQQACGSLPVKRGRGRADGVGEKPEADRGRGHVVHPGRRIPYVPYLVAQWRRDHPGQDIGDGQVFTQPWQAGPNGGRRDHVIYYQYKADRARRTLRGIDEQVKKAEQAVAGKTPVKRNRFVQLSGGSRKVNRELETKGRQLAGLQGYATNLRACPDGTPVTPEFVIGACHQFVPDRGHSGWSRATCTPGRSTTPLRDSIDAHLTIVFAAMAVSRWIENTTGWPIRGFVKTARRLSRPGARFRDCSWPVSPGRSPNPPCASQRSGLSMAVAVRLFQQESRGWRLCCRGSGTGLPGWPRSAAVRYRPR